MAATTHIIVPPGFCAYPTPALRSSRLPSSALTARWTAFSILASILASKPAIDIANRLSKMPMILHLNLVVLVLQDNAYGMIRWKQAADGLADFGMTFGNPDFAAYAFSVTC
jgi:hypothetical protein